MQGASVADSGESSSLTRIDLHRARWSGRRVLVTGGEGFIGSELARTLAAADTLVTVIDRTPQECVKNLQPVLNQIEYIPAELNKVALEELLRAKAFSAIFHLAGSASVPASVVDPIHDFNSNAIPTLNLVDALRRLHSSTHLVVFSSAAVYGDTCAEVIDENNPTAPISPYGVSKLAAERYVTVYSQLYGLNAAVVRPFTVYGPQLRRQVIYDFMCKLSRGEAFTAFGDGSQVRDFCYVTDTVDAALMVEQHGQLRGEIYNVASGSGCTIKRILDELTQLLRVQCPVQWSGTVRQGEPQRWVADIGRLQSLGWQPQVDIHEGLSRTVAWYQSTHGQSTQRPALSHPATPFQPTQG